MEHSTNAHFGSRVALLIGLVTAIAATVAVVAFVKRGELVPDAYSGDWEEAIGV